MSCTSERMKPHQAAAFGLIAGCFALISGVTTVWSGAPAVIDAKGREVGPYLNALQCGPEGVLLRLNGTFVNVPVNRNGFDGCGGYLFYESEDCSGTVFTGADLHTPSIADWAPIVAGNIIYYGDPAARVSVTTHSRRLLDRSVGVDKCETVAVNGTMLKAMTFDLSTLGFTPPFSISLAAPN
jgi:hypothetical protein